MLAGVGGYGDDADGNWTLFSANTPVITNKGLQVFESSTNQIRNNSTQGAATGSPGTLPTNWASFTLAGLTQTIVAIGAGNGIDYIDIRFSGTTNNTQIRPPFEGTQQIVAVSGQTWTNSAFLALVGGSFSNVTGGYVYFSLRDSGGAQLSSTGTAFTLVSLTSTMQRFSATATLINASLAYMQPLLRFTVTNGAAVEAAARAALPGLLVAGEDGALVWRSDIVSFPRVYDTQVVTTVTDPESGATVTQPTRLPYFYVWVSTPTCDLMLEALPSCLIVADRDRAEDGPAAFILYSALPSDQLGRYRIEGSPLGADYPFGS